MSIPAIVRQRSPRRLALILSAALALALLGGVPAQAQAAGGTLQVWAIGQEPDGDWVSLGPGVLVGEEVRPAGFTIPVGAEAHLTLLDSTLPGGTAKCHWWEGERSYEWRYDGYASWPADQVTPQQLFATTELAAWGVHDVPGDVDHYLRLQFSSHCL
jgi:hypothetical protein